MYFSKSCFAPVESSQENNGAGCPTSKLITSLIGGGMSNYSSNIALAHKMANLLRELKILAKKTHKLKRSTVFIHYALNLIQNESSKG